MRVYLRLEVLQFIPQVRRFQPAGLLLLLLVAGEEGDGQVEAQHQDGDHEIQQQGHGHPSVGSVSGGTERSWSGSHVLPTRRILPASRVIPVRKGFPAGRSPVKRYAMFLHG